MGSQRGLQRGRLPPSLTIRDGCVADTQTHTNELVFVNRQEVWSAQGWGWNGGVELRCFFWKSPCVLEERVSKDKRPRGFLERKAVEACAIKIHSGVDGEGGSQEPGPEEKGP